MIAFGVLVLLVIYGIFKGQNQLLKGAMIPFALLLVVLIGYGGYILYSRPAHATQSIRQFEQSETDAVVMEIEKHTNDNKAGKFLMKYVYPSLILISVIALFLFNKPYYQGCALGFILLFAATFVIDYGFVSRSDAFLNYLATL